VLQIFFDFLVLSKIHPAPECLWRLPSKGGAPDLRRAKRVLQSTCLQKLLLAPEHSPVLMSTQDQTSHPLQSGAPVYFADVHFCLLRVLCIPSTPIYCQLHIHFHPVHSQCQDIELPIEYWILPNQTFQSVKRFQ
jgi:hypothetical protein